MCERCASGRTPNALAYEAANLTSVAWEGVLSAQDVRAMLGLLDAAHTARTASPLQAVAALEDLLCAIPPTSCLRTTLDSWCWGVFRDRVSGV